jgi:hypothetical protein
MLCRGIAITGLPGLLYAASNLKFHGHLATTPLLQNQSKPQQLGATMFIVFKKFPGALLVD